MDLRQQIEEYIPYDEQEQKDKELILRYMDTFKDVLTRGNPFGHFSSSSWILNKKKDKVLFIFHKQYNSWSWTGGHNDGEEDALAVALREAKEETGIKNVTPISDQIYSIEVLTVEGHLKKGEYVPAHVHLNITFILEADEREELKIKEDENSGVKWIDIKEAVSLSSEPKMKIIYQKLIDKMSKIN